MKAVIWGLKNKRHSHRYIHAGFYENFKKMGFETFWVDDLESSAGDFKKDCLILAVDVASKFLPVHKSNKYILHNIDANKLGIFNETVSLQVHTTDSSGTGLGIPRISWNDSSRTLFQPWGISTEPEFWRPFNENSGSREYWIGSVWNNSLGQGNETEINKYCEALAANGYKFSKIGGTRWFTKEGVSENKSIEIISRSPIGSAVVGEWQRTSRYVPCRLFKNISAGKIPSSNSDFSDIFGDNFIHEENLNHLVSKVSSSATLDSARIVEEAQVEMTKYTYKNNIQRILELF